MRVGDTISLRVRTPEGPTDVVGTVLAMSASALTVRRRDGSIEHIRPASVEAGRVVPPGPHRSIATADLQRIGASGWRALDTASLGQWLLRASGGLTSRANSALPLGDPGMEPAAALAEVMRWYADRGLPPKLQMPDHVVAPALTALVDAAGWERSPTVHVMTAALGPVLRAAIASTTDVRRDSRVDDHWIAAWRREQGVDASVARELLDNHDRAVFASVRDGEACVAIARASVDGRWAGLFSVEVAPDARRRGLGRDVSIAALKWAAQNGARFAYLQVAQDNTGAIALYDSIGFSVHHDYHYRVGPLGSVDQ